MGAKEKMNDNKGSLGTSLEVWWFKIHLDRPGSIPSLVGELRSASAQCSQKELPPQQGRGDPFSMSVLLHFLFINHL